MNICPLPQWNLCQLLWSSKHNVNILSAVRIKYDDVIMDATLDTDPNYEKPNDNVEFKVSNDGGLTAEDHSDNSDSTPQPKRIVLNVVTVVDEINANQRPQRYRAQKSRRRNVWDVHQKIRAPQSPIYLRTRGVQWSILSHKKLNVNSRVQHRSMIMKKNQQNTL